MCTNIRKEVSCGKCSDCTGKCEYKFGDLLWCDVLSFWVVFLHRCNHAGLQCIDGSFARVTNAQGSVYYPALSALHVTRPKVKKIFSKNIYIGLDRKTRKVCTSWTTYPVDKPAPSDSSMWEVVKATLTWEDETDE